MSGEKQLALHGGPKTKTSPYGRGCKHDIDAITKALRARLEGVEQLPLAMGPSIKQLRQRLCEIFGVKHAVPTSSGTAAIHAGLASIGIKPGDEVITTCVSDHGTVIGIMQLGAIPVFADIDPDTLMIEAHTVAPLITPRTRAILVVHFAGCPTDMTAMMALARQRGLRVLEDCAQSWLARWDGRPAGTLGDVGCLSFNESKHVTTGEGGVILTNDDVMARYADAFVDKSYNRTGQGPVAPSMPAMNLRMSEINAVLGLLQLDKLNWIVQRRHELGELLHAELKDVAGVRVHRPRSSSGWSSHWRGVGYYDAEVVGVPVKAFIEAVAAEGISIGAANVQCMLGWPLFQALNKDPQAFATYRAPGLKPGMFEPGRCPQAMAAASRTWQAHISEFCTEEDMRQTASAIRKVVAALRGQALVA